MKMFKHLTLFAAAAVGTLVLGAPKEVEAGCAQPTFSMQILGGPHILTADTTTVVPTNVEIMVRYTIGWAGACPMWPDVDEFDNMVCRRVERADGTEVPGTWHRFNVPAQLWEFEHRYLFVPEAPLAPDTDHVIVDGAGALFAGVTLAADGCYDGDSKGLQPRVVKFRTASAADSLPPTLSGPPSVECTSKTVTVKAPDCDYVPCYATVTYVERQLCLSELVTSEAVWFRLKARDNTGSLMGSWTADAMASPDVGFCIEDRKGVLDPLFKAAVTTLSVEGIDAGGNVSAPLTLGWSTTRCIKLPAENLTEPEAPEVDAGVQQGGCNMGRGTGGTVPLVLLVLATSYVTCSRRRRRAASTSGGEPSAPRSQVS